MDKYGNCAGEQLGGKGADSDDQCGCCVKAVQVLSCQRQEGRVLEAFFVITVQGHLPPEREIVN
jgi:hypothetical protein